jgi:hypothetical protein
MNKMKSRIIFILILALASFFRLYGNNWDQGQHLHPDERFLTMVTTAIQWPKNLPEYLDTANSTLNPHNKGFGFFVYGTAPIFITKWIADLLKMDDYGNLTLLGRALSGIVDIGTTILVFLLAKEIVSSYQLSISGKKNTKQKLKLSSDFQLLTSYFPHISMFIYACMVLPIQLSHFYAVDTYLTFFITLTFFLLIKIINTKPFQNTKFYILNSLLGFSFGLALASKISAIYFSPILFLGYFYILLKNRNLKQFIVSGLIFIVFSFITIKLTQPYLFTNGNPINITLNPKVLDNWKQLKSFDGKETWFPPGVQWINTKPILFPLKNILFWGLGLPLGTLSIFGIILYITTLIFCLIDKVRKHLFHKSIKLILIICFDNSQTILFLSTLWIIILFIYQGIQFSKNMRYFYPLYPFISLITTWFIYQILYKTYINFKKVNLFILLFLGFVIIIYPLSFLSIYSRPTTRITASEWIYQNIPPGSTLALEHWDDGLPVPLPEKINQLKGIEFPMYGADTKEKWVDMNERLNKINYIVLSSNRLYGSIMSVPKRYNITSKYYESLFDGSLGFEKVAEFTSRPNIPIPGIKICFTPPFARYGIVTLKTQECNKSGISFVDDYADESFTVYDHPKVSIFKKVKTVNYFKLLYGQ